MQFACCAPSTWPGPITSFTWSWLMADPSTPSGVLLSDDGGPQRRHGHKPPRHTPWLAFILIFCILSSMIVSIAIVTASNNDPVKHWKFQPAVLLSVMTSIFIVSLEGLVAIGLAISWWRSIANGTTLKRLHFIWNGSNILNMIPAFMAGVDTRKVAFAALAIASNNSNGWFGTHSVDTAPGLQTMQNWYLNTTFFTSAAPGFYCKGNGMCEARVIGAGFNYGCDTSSKKLNLTDDNSYGAELFNITTYMSYEFNQSMLFLSTKYLNSVNGECIGEIVTETCNVIAATVAYPLIIKNTTISIDFRQLLSNRTVVSNYTSPGDAAGFELTDDKGPLSGLDSLMGGYMSTGAWLERSNVYHPTSPLSSLFYDANVSYPPSAEYCGISFKSPTDYVLTSFFEFMLRSALDVARNASDYHQDLKPYTTNFTSHFTGTELHYHSDFRYLAGAIVIIFIGLLAVVFLLWGWWELGRSVSLSPLETAKAFGAPITSGAGHEKEADRIIKEVGHEKVAYDGEELVWNDTVYASGRWEMGQVPTVKGEKEITEDPWEPISLKTRRSILRRGLLRMFF
ncbi:uncharacterized protein BDZ99DRAFT_494425 [Mytilinidion resinicola]|uniref:Uncharacterized protein n=1 Tax=Mytilinidion resinicola TaxID=574789 RepID=A0A6A6Z6A3_9PEZI|nr:uncharacterized protein BDZ99DRAFT_494425 [Mytilinidion resinicola]KAF2816631.1 hypothetical protein BDZ99DRAFT_494425 [Mytilinidion resinicola]